MWLLHFFSAVWGPFWPGLISCRFFKSRPEEMSHNVVSREIENPQQHCLTPVTILQALFGRHRGGGCNDHNSSPRQLTALCGDRWHPLTPSYKGAIFLPRTCPKAPPSPPRTGTGWQHRLKRVDLSGRALPVIARSFPLGLLV